MRIALNLKGIAVDVVNIDLMKDEQRNADFKKLNPQMRIPSLVIDDGPPLFQSLAIIEYLDETHPKPPLLPADARGRARVRGLAMITSSDAHPLLVPSVREFLEHEYKLDEEHLKWGRHWVGIDAFARAHPLRQPGAPAAA